MTQGPCSSRRATEAKLFTSTAISIGATLVMTFGFFSYSEAQQLPAVDSEPLFAIDVAAAEFDESDILILPEPSEDTAVVRSTPNNDSLQIARASSSAYRYVLLSVNGWPEFKMDTRIKCIVKNPFNGDCALSIKVPQLFRRTSRLQHVATVYLDRQQDYREQVRDCLEEGILAGTLAGVFTGSLVSAAGVLEAYLKVCLVAKEVGAKIGVDVSLRVEKVPGRWRPV